MNRLILTAIIFMALTKVSLGQYTTCQQAVSDLQNYAVQVNTFYNNEYWNVIPNQRCPAYDVYNRPFYPQQIQACRWQMLSYLNQWYAQQCRNVNIWYTNIYRACAVQYQSQSSISKPAPSVDKGDQEAEPIDTGNIEDLSEDIVESKAVKIKIPRTPSGYRPRN